MRKPPSIDVLALRRKEVTSAELKELGDARRVYEARLRSGWDSYNGAIEAAHGGDVSRLVDCLRGRKALADSDRKLLASYVARKLRRRFWPSWLAQALGGAPTEKDFARLADEVEKVGRKPGGVLDEKVHRAARLAEVLMSLVSGRVPDAVRTVVIERGCEIEGDEAGVAIDPERVRDLLNRPKARRHRSN